MNEGLIPRRYAKALLKFAREKGQAKEVYSLMKTLAASFVANPGLSTAVANPFVPAASKTSLLMTAAGATKSDTCYVDFLALLIHNNRVALVRETALAYLTLYREANNIFLVDLTTASPLPKEEMDRLKELIDRHVNGATVEYHVDVDPDLIGGFVIKIDSERLDASLKNELKQLRLKLLSK